MSEFVGVGLSVADDLLTVGEAAAITRMSKSWWRQQVFMNRVEFLKIGRSVRIRRQTVDDLLASSLVPARSKKQH